METLLIEGIIVQKMFRGENLRDASGNSVTLLLIECRTVNSEITYIKLQEIKNQLCLTLKWNSVWQGNQILFRTFFYI